MTRTGRWWMAVALALCLVAVPAVPAQAVDTTSWFRLVTVGKDLSVAMAGASVTFKARRVGSDTLVPLALLRQAWGATYTVSPAVGSVLTIGSRRVVWQGKSPTYQLDGVEKPWGTPPVTVGRELYFPLLQLMQPLGAQLMTDSGSGAILCAYSTRWQKEPWLRQPQLAELGALSSAPARLTQTGAKQKVVAFTFDDNWDAVSAQRMAELFHTYHGHCTFFLIGTNVRMHPETIRTMVRLGNDIGNHTLSHPAATSTTDDNFIKQVRACEQVLNAMGLTTRPYFRFPYFAEDQHLLKLVTDQGYITVGSAYTMQDTGSNRSAALSAATVRRYIRPGVIFVGHANSPVAYEAMKILLPELARQGYRFVSLTELLAGT